MTKKKVSQEQLQQAWDVVSDFLNQHDKFSFHIDPWTKNGIQTYTLNYMDEGNQVDIVTAKRKWKK